MEFSDWIFKKYIEYRGNAVGQEKSLSKFAKEIGVSQSLMSQWMTKNGSKTPRNQETITRLVNFFGLEVYDVLGLPIPGISTGGIPFSDLPPELQSRLSAAMNEINVLLKEKNISSEEEAFKIASEVFASHSLRAAKVE